MFSRLKANKQIVTGVIKNKHDLSGFMWFELGQRFVTRPVRKTVNKTCYYLLLLTFFCQISVQAEILQDPTAPSGHASAANKSTGTKAAPQWVLTSILIATDRRLANINGTMVSVGAQVAGARVTVIEPDYVQLRKGDKELVLELLPKVIKQVAKGTQP